MCIACRVTQRMADVEARLHSTPSEWLWTEFALLRERYAVRDHPYTSARRRAELSRSDLHLLATEYDHVLVAIAAALGRASGVPADAVLLAEQELRRWRRFASATGWQGGRAWFYGEDPFPETVALAQCLARRDGLTPAETVARVYALRAVEGDGNGQLARLLEDTLSTMPVEDPFAVLAAVRETLDALWAFYDRLEAHRVPAPEAVA
jgi:hypothetical protein